MKITYIDIKDLKPYKNNPRNNETAVGMIENSIKDFGFLVPLVITKDLEIICGHTRYEASKKLNLKQLPCIIDEELTPEQIKLFRIIDNKSSEYAEWETKLLYEELEEILNIDMEKYGFFQQDIDWDEIEDLDIDNYEEPQHKMHECPYCHHIDRDIHFKKVKQNPGE